MWETQFWSKQWGSWPHDKRQLVDIPEKIDTKKSVIANIELRLGSKKSCTNKDIWKYYIEYLRDRNPIAMLEVYLRYCRFFISDIEMVKKYRNEIERIGKLEAVSVFWIDTIEWELEFGDLKTAQSLLKEAVKDLTDIPKVLSEENFMKVFGKCKRKMKESDEENFDVPSKRRRIQTPSSVEDEDDGNEEDKNEEKVVKKYVDDYEEQDSDEEEEEEYEDESDEDEENEGDESDESEDDSEKSEKILKRRVRISSSEDDVTFCAYGILTNFSRFISKLFKCEATHMS
uniref:Suppressor of forked domain-containing protein n=1 Tax=Panagrolaimus sp. PS1159 TaxID=55785 RepID=A0AC35GAU7_9BILA